MRAVLREAGLEGALILGTENRFYLSGFTGSAGILYLDAEGAFLLTDGRYATQAQDECPGWEVLVKSRIFPEGVAELVKERGIGSLGVEAHILTWAQWQALSEALPTIKLVPCRDVVEKLRLIKEPEEIGAIRQALALTEEGFRALLPELKAGMSEREWALKLEFYLRERGAEEVAFPFIVASGPRSALPHGIASGKRIGPGDLVVIDIGIKLGRYCSDFTRTVVVGRPTPWQQELYRAVLEAQRAAIATVRPGIPAKEVDRAAREVLASYGYGLEIFPHSTGHGLGLAVHEAPRVGEGEETRLEPGMVITIEPGAYLPGKGGIRIEDVVLVTETGAEVLTITPKEELLTIGG
ncbi:M24 family metallopeptidase [Ammonifex degensii]|uniref:M24 family metallopeptidase n=1 Tax=Ammonifex degensii TaxID=42838 RepID=UPI000A04D6E1|nr:Xaa-Pro peptidase family protein [Ammonifex degensii]